VLARPIESMPGQGEVPETVEEIGLTAGGPAGGAAVSLARLGAEAVAVGAVGEDSHADFLVEALRREGVDPVLARKPGAQTSAAILAIHPDGSHRGWHVAGADGELGPDDVSTDLLASCDAVHLGGLTALPGLDGDPAGELLGAAKERGALTTADCHDARTLHPLRLLKRCLPQLDVFMSSRAELLKIAETSDVSRAAQRLRKLGAGAVIATSDADGYLLLDEEGEREVAPIEGPVVDSTGCGEAFSAGVIAALCRGWALDRAAQLGAAAASLTLTGLGSGTGLRSFDDTVAHMEEKVAAQDDR
jgi:sugar/nucleoside kinase (ribokinase family)